MSRRLDDLAWQAGADYPVCPHCHLMQMETADLLRRDDLEAGTVWNCHGCERDYLVTGVRTYTFRTEPLEDDP